MSKQPQRKVLLLSFPLLRVRGCRLGDAARPVGDHVRAAGALAGVAQLAKAVRGENEERARAKAPVDDVGL